MAVSRERKAALNREYRRRRAIREGRVPGRTGRPPQPKAPVAVPVEIPPLHVGHELFDQARAATAIQPDERSRTLVRRDTLMREDGLSEAVLALLEKRDPAEAWRRYRSRELAWIYRTSSPVPEE